MPIVSFNLIYANLLTHLLTQNNESSLENYAIVSTRLR